MKRGEKALQTIGLMRAELGVADRLSRPILDEIDKAIADIAHMRGALETADEFIASLNAALEKK